MHICNACFAFPVVEMPMSVCISMSFIFYMSSDRRERMPKWLQLSCTIIVWIGHLSECSTTARVNFYEVFPQQYCLYYYVHDDIIDYNLYSLPKHQLIPYCLPKSLDDVLDLSSLENEFHVHHYLTLAELKHRQTSVDQMIEWSVPMALVERYQIFLDGLDESLSSQIVPNCTKGWFGPRCQYTFYAEEVTFAELVREIFLGKYEDENRDHFTNGTCYMHLPCDHGPSPACLDWREICDGKWDCLDGVDEPQECLDREANECTKGYYRCHNGQCIPDEFYHDGDLLNPDCADWTDIEEDPTDRSCSADPAFRCEEHVCANNDEYSCGDGQCTTITELHRSKCKHNRFSLAHRQLFENQTNPHLSPLCSSMMTCLSTVQELLGIVGAAIVFAGH